MNGPIVSAPPRRRAESRRGGSRTVELQSVAADQARSKEKASQGTFSPTIIAQGVPPQKTRPANEDERHAARKH
jgi:hypothetical protein